MIEYEFDMAHQPVVGPVCDALGISWQARRLPPGTLRVLFVTVVDEGQNLALVMAPELAEVKIRPIGGWK
jgi:hypothetical protein